MTREGFPLAHYTLPGNSKDVQTVERVVQAVEKRFGKSQRVWVMDRGMISKDTLAFLGQSGRRYLLATKRAALAAFQKELGTPGWQRLPDREVDVKLLRRGRLCYLLARSKPRRHKERAIRRRQRRGLAKALKKLQARVANGRLKQRDQIAEAIGKLKERYPKARAFVDISISDYPMSLHYTWKVAQFKAALARDGAYLLRSNQAGWSAQEFWETYIQLTVVERAFQIGRAHV